MNIGISAFAGDGGKSGISQYIKHILKRLPEHCNDRFTLFLSVSDYSFLELDETRFKVVIFPDWVASPVINILWHLICLPVLLKLHHCDCVYLPVGNRRLGWIYGVPSVATIHDMSQLHIPAKYDALRMFYIMHLLPLLMRRLTRIVSISQSTSRDLTEYVGISDEKIDIVYNGADVGLYTPRIRTKARARLEEALNFSEPYLLYVSRLEHPGKNHVRLIQAFAALKEKHNLPHKLVLVGSRWNGAEAIDAAVIEHCMETEVVFPGFVANEQLPDLYAAAELFVFPSLFEGFGIPPLEAMAAAIPVVAADVSSIPEVVGSAGLLFDPYQSNEIEQCIYKVLHNKILHRHLCEKGLVQVEKFSWDSACVGVITACHHACRKNFQNCINPDADLLHKYAAGEKEN